MSKILRLYLAYILLGLCFTACNFGKQQNIQKHQNYYDDGKYCAEVSYYNPHTASESTYYLKVDIEEDKLVCIYFSNGGWLDDTHFTPPVIEDGYAEFTSDKGYYFRVTILEDEDCETSRFEDSFSEEEEGYNEEVDEEKDSDFFEEDEEI